MHMFVNFAALAALIAFAVPAHAQKVYTVYGTDNNGVFTTHFGTLDLQTGALSLVNTDAAYSNMTALGFGSDGRLYGLSDENYALYGPEDQYVIDPKTGGLTLNASYSGVSVTGASAGGTGIFTGLATLARKNSPTLFTLDPVTQTFTVGAQFLGDAEGLVVADGAGSIYASAADLSASGALTDTLDKITDNGTGTFMMQGNTGLGSVGTGLFFQDRLYTTAQDQHGLPGVYTLNTDTGAANFVTAINLPGGATFLAAALAPTPEPSEVTVVGVGLIGVCVLGLCACRRSAKVRPRLTASASPGDTR